MKKMIKGWYVLFALVVLGGCGAKKLPPSDSSEMTEQKEEQAEEKDDLAGERVEFLFEGPEGGYIQADAEKTEVGYTNASIYNLTLEMPSEDLAKQYADSLFDYGEYRTYEIEEDAEVVPEPTQESNFLVDPEEFPDEIYAYKGDVDGERYTFCMMYSPRWETRHTTLEIVREGYEDREEEVSQSELVDTPDIENKQNLHSSQEKAEHFLELLHMSDWNLIHTAQLRDKQTDELQLDGYAFVYAPNFGGATLGPIEESLQEEMDEQLGQVRQYWAEQPLLYVVVKNDAVCRVRLNAIYSWSTALEDDCELLAFDYILEIAKEYYENWAQTYNSTEYEIIEKVEFNHCLIATENEYVLMPVWVFWSSYYRPLHITKLAPSLAVNAIDGSIITLFPGMGTY